MPKETFLNLHEEKRKMIIEETKKVITNYEFEDINISLIVKSCNIPRGSFYSYFVDLNDLFSYVFAELIAKLNQQNDKILSSVDNMFDYCLLAFRSELKFIRKSNNMIVLIKLMKYIPHHIKHHTFYLEKMRQREIILNFDRSSFKDQSDEFVSFVFDTIVSYKYNQLFYSEFSKKKSIIVEDSSLGQEDVEVKYSTFINIIKYGCLMEEEKC